VTPMAYNLNDGVPRLTEVDRPPADPDPRAEQLQLVTALSADLDPDVVLGRLAIAAAAVTGAGRAAIGRLDGSGAWRPYTSTGLTDAAVDRLAEAHADHACLVVPVPDGDPPAAVILADKRGGGDFDAADARAVATLAAAAGRAIAHAALVADAREQAQLLAASAEIVGPLATGAPEAEVLDVITRWAREITGAETAAIAVPDDDELVVVAGTGAQAAKLHGLRVPSAGTPAVRVMREGQAEAIGDIAAPANDIGYDLPFDTGLVAPMGQGRFFQGILAVASPTDRAPVPPARLPALTALAERAGMALELAGRRRNAQRMVTLEERERIAAGLRGSVIPRLLSVASTLAATAGLISHREAQVRLRHAMEDVDNALAEIRSTLFG